jgi:WD40 repeat protein
MSSFEDSILRVLKGDLVVGAAFLVSDCLIATCAHVIEAAGAKVGGKIYLQLAGGKQVEALVEPEFWRDSNREDIAILRLGEPLENLQPLILGSSSGTKGHKFSTFGFPNMGQELSGGGEIIGLATIDRINLLQLRSPEVTPGFSGAPIFDEITKRVVGMVVTITPPDEYQRLGTTAFAIPSETIRQVCSELRISEICPYRSLDVFNEEDASYFFGRERVVQKIVDNLKREPRFLAVLGPSGSGKSSVVRAGLIPALKQNKVPGSEKWGVITIRPANQPFDQLNNGGLSKSQDGLESAVRAWLENHPKTTRLILLIDQFEEVLVSTPEDIRTRFIKEIAHLLDAHVPITLVLTIRDDFYSRFLRDASALASWLERGLVNIPTTLDEDELRAMVSEPAKAVGLTFEDGLVKLILDDAAEIDRSKGLAQSTVLPLLEFALTQLWEKRQDRHLTHESYHSIGRVTGGLVQWADETYYALNSNEQKIAKEIFSQLVHLGEEKEHIPDTRRVKPINELEVSGQKTAIESVVSKLINARLLSTERDLKTGQEFVEIIHEALLREWGLFKTWLDNFRNREQIARDRRRRWIIIGLGIGLLTMIGIAVLAGIQWKRAETQSRVALARQLAAQAQFINTKRDTNQIIGVLLAVKSMQMFPSSEAAEVLQDNLLASSVAKLTHDNSVISVAFSPDGKWVVSGSLDGTVRIWEAKTGKEISRMKHRYAVTAVSFSPNGRWVVSGAKDNTARVWDAQTGKEIAHFAHTNEVLAVAFSPDSTRVVSGGRDNRSTVWDAKTGKEISHMTYDGNVSSMTFGPDGKWVVSGSDDKTARVWDSAIGQEISRMVHNDKVNSVAFSRDGTKVVSGSEDGTARVWEAKTGHEITRMDNEANVYVVAFSPDGKSVVSGGSDRTATVWDSTTGQEISHMIHNYAVSSLAFSPNGKWIVSAGDTTARVWDADSGVELSRMTHANNVNATAFSPNGKWVISGSNDNTAIVWNAKPQQEIAEMTHGGPVIIVRFSPNGRYVASGSSDHTVRLLDVATGVEILHMPHDELVRKLAFSSDGRMIVTGSYDKTARVWDVKTGKEIARMTHDDGVWDVAISPDGKWVVSGSGDKTARVWDVKTGKEIARMTHDDAVRDVAISPDGKWVVSGSDDKTARVWDVKTGKEIARMTHDGTVNSVAISPDGKLVVSGSDDKTIRIWDPMTGKEIARMIGNEKIWHISVSPDGKQVVSDGYDSVLRIWNIAAKQEISHIGFDNSILTTAYSQNGKWIAAGGWDNTARVIEPATGREIVRFTLTDAVDSIDFSPDSKWIVVGGRDNIVRVWLWQPQDLVSNACSRLPRNLTRDEWKQYLGSEPYRAICTNLPIEPESPPVPTPTYSLTPGAVPIPVPSQ